MLYFSMTKFVSLSPAVIIKRIKQFSNDFKLLPEVAVEKKKWIVTPSAIGRLQNRTASATFRINFCQNVCVYASILNPDASTLQRKCKSANLSRDFRKKGEIRSKWMSKRQGRPLDLQTSEDEENYVLRDFHVRLHWRRNWSQKVRESGPSEM